MLMPKTVFYTVFALFSKIKVQKPTKAQKKSFIFTRRCQKYCALLSWGRTLLLGHRGPILYTCIYVHVYNEILFMIEDITATQR